MKLLIGGSPCTQHNFPETIQLGDAFQVRNDDWRVEERMKGV